MKPLLSPSKAAGASVRVCADGAVAFSRATFTMSLLSLVEDVGSSVVSPFIHAPNRSAAGNASLINLPFLLMARFPPVAESCRYERNIRMNRHQCKYGKSDQSHFVAY